MPKSKTITIRVPIEKYYEFLKNAATQQKPISTYINDVLTVYHSPLKAEKGVMIESKPTQPQIAIFRSDPISDDKLYRVVYDDTLNITLVTRPTGYYSDKDGNFYNSHKSLIKLPIENLKYHTKNGKEVLFFFAKHSSYERWFECKIEERNLKTYNDY